MSSNGWDELNTRTKVWFQLNIDMQYFVLVVLRCVCYR